MNNPSGASDIQRNRLTYLINKGIISGSAEGICLLTYDQAQDLIDKFEGIESISKKKRVEVKSDIQYSGKCLSQFEIGKEISGEVKL